MHKLNNHLFIDIETVSAKKNYSELCDVCQSLWYKKAKQIQRNRDIEQEVVEEVYSQKAGIYSEFSQIVCISVGYFVMMDDQWEFRVKSFYDDDETQILEQFCNLLGNHFHNAKKDVLVGHNIREFDIPFIARRCIINGIKLPKLLSISNKKPWEVRFIKDTLEMWKFGDYKHYTSLDLLAHILKVESSKTDIDGSQVGGIYWKEHDLERIYKYCEKDVITTMKVYLKIEQIDVDSEIKILQLTQ